MQFELKFYSLSSENGIFTSFLLRTWLHIIITKMQNAEITQFVDARSIAASMTDNPIRQITGDIVRGPINLIMCPTIPDMPMKNSKIPARVMAP